MKSYRSYLVAGNFLLMTLSLAAQQSNNTIHVIHPLNLRQVQVHDAFWSPKYKIWTQKTVYDVFDKLEGKYTPDREDLIKEKQERGVTRNAFLNFDQVAQGQSNTGQHEGPPWYDGLVYESIRGAADLLIEYPDPKLEAKLDAYITRIAAAQKAAPDGYLNTYTTLIRPTQPWGTNGGDDNWQHDVYNAGMLTEAGIHYYQATGKKTLLQVTVKICNLMSETMGASPKKNVIPGHGGPEEALVKLYWLFKNDPALAKKLDVETRPDEYLRLAKFWIENRGDHGEQSGNTRPNFGAYGQDDKPVFDQTSIEGHAVRATLLATGVATTALENKDNRYIATSNTYWNSMIGKKTFITGGQGAIHKDEKFGPDYFLPESAYLETCAAIGSAFFSARMNELMGDGKYMDAFERVLYNNILSGISLNGDQYFYENPLKAKDHQRWEWHSCPCCPPMILKIFGTLPEYIYAQDENNLFVNLFIGSSATIQLNNTNVAIEQKTEYPWKGTIQLRINPEQTKTFAVRVRIPGWATGVENPFGLYQSTTSKGKIQIKVNGKNEPLTIENGYAVIQRSWTKNDQLELSLPLAPRYITTSPDVQELRSKTVIAAGPIIYGLESIDNPGVENIRVKGTEKLLLQFKPGLLNGVNVVTGEGNQSNGSKIKFSAVPFYGLGNRKPGAYYQVWLPQ